MRQRVHLKEIMDRSVISIAMVAKASQLSRGTIERILAGKPAKPETLHKIADALKVPIQQLVTLEEDPPASSGPEPGSKKAILRRE